MEHHLTIEASMTTDFKASSRLEKKNTVVLSISISKGAHFSCSVSNCRLSHLERIYEKDEVVVKMDKTFKYSMTLFPISVGRES